MTFFETRVSGYLFQKWFFTLVTCLAILAGFEALSFLTGIYQIQSFLQVALVFYIFLVGMITFVFDIKLKTPRSWGKSLKYYLYSEQRFLKWLKIFGRALKGRCQYLFQFHHWLHFQNYMILPAMIYWGVAMLIFLNPFSFWVKQSLAATGAMLMAVVIWYLKDVFTNYTSVQWPVRNLMFAIHVTAGFLVFSGALGLIWYLGLPAYVFYFGVFAVGFLLMHQGLFRLQAITSSNIRYVFWGSVLLGLAAAVVYRVWTVNFYTGGLMIADVLFLYWGLCRIKIKKHLTRRNVMEHVLVFLFILLFVLATTNFHARIG